MPQRIGSIDSYWFSLCYIVSSIYFEGAGLFIFHLCSPMRWNVFLVYQYIQYDIFSHETGLATKEGVFVRVCFSLCLSIHDFQTGHSACISFISSL